MSNEVEIAQIQRDLKYIKEVVTEIKNSVFGNGSKGIKGRVIELEVKFWILFILVATLLGVDLHKLKGLF